MSAAKYYNDARNKSSQRYNAQYMEIISYRAYLRDRINERVATAATRAGISKRQYLHNAICAALERDGATLDSLPPVSAAGSEAADADG